VFVADAFVVAIWSSIVANKDHIQPLMAALASQSMASWNQWRLENPSIRPDLLGVELADANLSFANLSYADIRQANLSGANLRHANLRHADLHSTNLQKADLREADLCGSILSRADLSGSILNGADLSGAIMRDTILPGTNLIDASLKNIHLGEVDLEGVLIDPEATGEKKIGSSRGISYLEKLALGLFKRAKGKNRLPVNKENKPHRSGKHI